jgi:hypothetical protein
VYTTQLRVDTATIAEAGTATDGALNLEDGALIGFVVKTGWTAADMGFSVLYGSTWYPVYDSHGNEVLVDVAADTFVSIPPSVLPSMGRVKLRSGATGASVAQDSARTILVYSRKV